MYIHYIDIIDSKVNAMFVNADINIAGVSAISIIDGRNMPPYIVFVINYTIFYSWMVVYLVK